MQLRKVDDRLAFGRLEVAVDASESDSSSGSTDASVYRYIGRLGLRDEDLQPILLDWRGPQTSAFYQAIAATPLGARARRHLLSKGCDIVRIEDEILDAALLESGSSTLHRGAFLAALAAQRTGYRAHERYRVDDPGGAGPDHPFRVEGCARIVRRACSLRGSTT